MPEEISYVAIDITPSPDPMGTAQLFATRSGLFFGSLSDAGSPASYPRNRSCYTAIARGVRPYQWPLYGSASLAKTLRDQAVALDESYS